MIARLAAICVALLFSTVLSFADPVGSYKVRGSNPGKESSQYSGTVEVSRTGETYKVSWEIAGQSFVGTGIGTKDFLAVSYRSGNQTGLALYALQSDGSWVGVWTYANGRQIGNERWVPE